MTELRRPDEGGGYTSIYERRLSYLERELRGGPVGPREVQDFEPLDDVSVWGLIAGYLGVALHGVMAYFPYGLALFSAPLPVIIGQYVAWAALLRLAVKQREDRPWLSFLVPIVSLAAWLVMMYVGMTHLGWSPIRIYAPR